MAVLGSTLLLAALTPGVAGADATIALPTEFTGTLSCGSAFMRTDGLGKPSVPDEVGEDGVERSTVSAIWRFPVLEVSDERLGGRYLGYQEGMDFRVDGDEIGVFSGLWQISNDGGEWIGPSTLARLSPIEYSTVTSRLDGQGGYEGLTAVIEFQWRADCGYDLQGFIFENSLPDYPTPVAE